ncbi:MAG: hypothetical protein E6G64_17035 [Actinobacteria bacterium]|nr:MAG: hypothetical protein E6G64_17035 [Actinomycetota bacterium]
MAEQFRILEGSTFCICDELGDFHADVEGLFAEDTRFLSGLNMTINGKRPLLLSSGRIEYFSAAFFTRNPLAGDLERDELSIRRERFVGDGAMQDTFVVHNSAQRPREFELALQVASDFADIFAVKDHDFSLGDPLHAEPLPPLVPGRFDEENNQFLLEDTEDGSRTQIILTQRGRVQGGRVTYPVELAPRERWELVVDVFPSLDGQVVVPVAAERDALACLRAVGLGSRVAADALGRHRHRQASGRGRAVVHERLRPRHDHHLSPDLAVRPRAGAHGARGPRRAPGH